MKFLALIAVLIESFLTGVRPGVRGPELRVGRGAVVITPPAGTPLSGYYEPRGSTGVLDDIYSKAMAIEQGGVKVAIVVCDLLTIPRQTMIVELANGSIGYIPNKSAYAEGNYEVVSARCAEGAGELMVATAIELLNELSSKGGTK